MSSAIAALVLLLVGCDQVFGLGGRVAADAPRLDDAPRDTAVGTDAALCSIAGHDEDLDSVRDECDNCPTIQNIDQANGDADLVGDACDPNPGSPGDRIVQLALFHNTPDGFIGSGATAFDVDEVVLSPNAAISIPVASIPRVDVQFDLVGTGPTSHLDLAVIGTTTHSCRIRASLCTSASTNSSCLRAANGASTNLVDWTAISATSVSRLRLQSVPDRAAFAGPLGSLTAPVGGAPVPTGTLRLSAAASTVTITSVVVYGGM